MQSQDPTYPLYSVMSFLGFVVVLIPFSWHLQAWNAGTCAYMFWVSFACLIEFINSLIWSGNLYNNIPVWCDICKHPLTLSFRVSDPFFKFSNKVYGRCCRWRCSFFFMHRSPPVWNCFNSGCLYLPCWRTSLFPLSHPVLLTIFLNRNVVYLSLIFALPLASQDRKSVV